MITEDKRRKRTYCYKDKKQRYKDNEKTYKKRSSNYVKKSEVNILATKKLKKYLKKMKKDKLMEQLQNFEKSNFLMMRSLERA